MRTFVEERDDPCPSVSCMQAREMYAEDRLAHSDYIANLCTRHCSDDAPAPDAHLDDDSILEMPGEDLE